MCILFLSVQSPVTTATITGWILQYKHSSGSAEDEGSLLTVHIMDSSIHHYVFSDLTPGTAYLARVAGNSEMGVGTFSEYQMTSTLTLLASGKPINNFTEYTKYVGIYMLD